MSILTNNPANRNVLMGFDHGRSTVGTIQTGTIKTREGDITVKYDHKRREDPASIDRLSGKCFPHKLGCVMEDKDKGRTVEVSVKYGDGTVKDDLSRFAMISAFLNQVDKKL